MLNRALAATCFTLLMTAVAYAGSFPGEDIRLKVVVDYAGHINDLTASFYLQHVDTGEVVYYVPASEVRAKNSGKKFIVNLTSGDLSGLNLDWSAMRWSARIDAAGATSDVRILRLDTLIDEGEQLRSRTDGPSFGFRDERVWIIETLSGDIPGYND